MERLSRVAWSVGTVRAITRETERAASLLLEVPGWPGHVAGQHVDVRLTAADGYRTERSYSIAPAPEQRGVTLTVERIDGGEVSPYLVGELRTGDLLELRGPIGGPFAWRAGDGGPVLLIGGGSGLVPLMSMLRHHAASGSNAQLRLLASARTYETLLYAAELACLGTAATRTVSVTLTRARPPGWEGFSHRADATMLAAVAHGLVAPKVFVCGPTAFVETVADALVANGHPPDAIRTERFGPTGP